MKRLGLTLVAAVCLTATTFAAGNQPTTAKWEGNINITKLSKYLNLDSNQQMANTVAEATGAKTMLFHTCHNVTRAEFESGATYLSLMQNNVLALKAALN